MPHGGTILHYVTEASRPRFWMRRRFVIVAVGVVTLFGCYVGAWLSVPDFGVDADGGNWGTDYHRIPGLQPRNRFWSRFFDPAYRLDRWLRPRHWNWTESP